MIFRATGGPRAADDPHHVFWCRFAAAGCLAGIRLLPGSRLVSRGEQALVDLVDAPLFDAHGPGDGTQPVSPPRGRDGREGVAAVLFDMDGLLVDTEPLWTVAEHELAASLGARFTPDIKAAMIGHGVDTALPLMLSMLGVPDADPHAAARFLIERTAELFGEPGRIIPMPGAVALLDALAAAGIATALVSSSFRVLMDPVLAAIGPERFAVTVAGDEVSRRKPHPEPYLTAARMLGVDPAQCVVLEDSEAGARAGLDAGCPTILVPSFPATAVHPVVAEATVRPSLHEVTVDLLDLLVTQTGNTGRYSDAVG